MTKKEVIRKVLELIQTEMNTFDFKINVKEQGFRRDDGDKIYFYYFLIYNEFNIKTGAKGFQIEPYADIDILGIEKFYNQITINTQIKNNWNHFTIGNGIANLIANPDGINRKRNQSLDLYVFDGAHIQIVANHLIKKFKDVALPYFLTNNTVKRVDELFNKLPREYTVHMPNDLFRFVKGVIAAKLNNNPEVNKLLSIYNSLIIERDMPEDCKIEMARLEEILPSIR